MPLKKQLNKLTQYSQYLATNNFKSSLQSELLRVHITVISKKKKKKGALRVMVIIIGNGIDNSISNPR